MHSIDVFPYDRQSFVWHTRESQETFMEPLSPGMCNDILDLVGRLYDAPDKTDLLATFQTGVKSLFPIYPLLFYLPVDTCSGKWEVNGYRSLPEEAPWARDWALFYLRIDPLAQAAFSEGVPQALRYVDCIDEDDFLQSRFYRDFFSRIPATSALLLPLVCHGERSGAVWVLRQEKDGEFSDPERNLGSLLAYHLSRAMLLVTLREHPALCGKPGVLVYDGDRNLLYRNDRAETILGKTDLRWCLDHPEDPTPVVQTERGVFHCRVLSVSPVSASVAREKMAGRVVILESYRKMPLISKGLSKFSLSARQSEIVLEVIRGRSNKEIAEKLGIALQTVKDHMYDIFRQLGVRSRTELVAAVVREIGEGGE